MAQLICDNLSLGYDGKTVIENISFSVNRGDYLCIAGANGSGKSTLIKTILNLQPPLSGNVSTGDGFSFDKIGYLPQQTVVQRDFPASVSEIVLSGCVGRCKTPFYGKEQKKSASENMERLGISHLAKCCYRQLSGGQQQRVLLARALCSAVDMLLLDEPVAGLDPTAASDMYQIVEKLNRDDITVIMVSHDVAAIMKYADHVLYLGENVFFGTREECIAKGIFGTKGREINA